MGSNSVLSYTCICICTGISEKRTWPILSTLYLEGSSDTCMFVDGTLADLFICFGGNFIRSLQRYYMSSDVRNNSHLTKVFFSAVSAAVFSNANLSSGSSELCFLWLLETICVLER